jgi:transposase
LFRIVLSHSRKGYSEAVWRQTTESFIRCLGNAFRYYGGVPKTLVIDNLRAAVTRADWYDPELNAKPFRPVHSIQGSSTKICGLHVLLA